MNLKTPLLQGRSFLLGLALAAALFGVGAPAAQADTTCPQHFVQGKAPLIVNQRMTARTHELCFATFALVHSGLTRTALWSAERISKASVSHARQQVRVNDFHADPRLPAGDRAELSDYQRSGFDRGHLQYPVKSILIGSFAYEVA
jgi:endonuclease G